MKAKFIMLLVILAMIIVACDDKPSQEYVLGEQLLFERFDSADSWETYQDEIAFLRPEDGTYRIAMSDANLFVWGQNERVHTNVVIEVETRQISTFENNGYGIVCRADEANLGNGYYFFISGDGFYSIARSEGDNLLMLVDWKSSNTIKKGQSQNTIRIACIDDYLGLWVNNKFLTEARDTVYTSGVTAMTAAINEEGQNVDIAFDNLQIWTATLK